MPSTPTGTLSPIASAGIGLAGQIAGAAANSYLQNRTNRLAQEFAVGQTNQQRQWALEDWDKFNAYNSPTEQMKRLRDAGLNPNLVYGNGATATTSSPVRASAPAQWSPHAPQVNPTMVGDSVGQFMNTKMQNAQYDNLRLQSEVLKQDAFLKAAQTFATTATGNNKGFQSDALNFKTELSRDLRQTTIEAARAGLQNITSNTAMVNAKTGQISSMVDEIAQRIKNMKKDEQLKEMEIQLNKLGLSKGDPLWTRIVGRIINKVAPDAIKP